MNSDLLAHRRTPRGGAPPGRGLLRHRAWTAMALPALSFLLSGCPALSGGPGSNQAPVADAGPAQVVRSQTLVTLTGKDSHDPDGVIQAFQWKQVSGTPVTLTKATNSTSTFLLPEIFSPTTLEFELTVTDDKGATGTARVKVDALPPPDPDRFLTLLDVPRTFKVVAATPAASTADAGTAFNVHVATRVDYNVYVDGVAQGRSKTYHQTATGQWPAAGSGGNDPADYRNPRLTFDLPNVNFEDLRSDLADNEQIYNSERNTLQVTTTVTLTSDAATELYVLDGAGNGVLDGGGNPVGAAAGSSSAPAVSFSTNDGTLNELFTQRDANANPITDEESEKTAEAYYKAIDPNGDKDTLAKFKAADGFVDGDPGIAHVTYINGFDLGFARDMYMRTDGDGNVYSYVINAPNLESALSHVNTIAAVAMEYSPAPGALPSDPNKYTKFYTYVLNPASGTYERVTTMDFDGRGEKYHPGTCTSCHGGRPAKLNPDGTYPNQGDIGAGFLPWDVSTLYFSDVGFEADQHQVQPDADQRDALRRLNEMVLLTNPPAAENTIIHGWYGSTDLSATTLPADANFNPDFVPDGWLPGNPGGPPADKAADAKTLYLQVLAPFCRACHSQRTEKSTISFDTYDKFVNSEKGKITELVFDKGEMPLARHTMDNFWTETTPSAGAILADKLGVPATRVPGTPTAVIDRAVINGTTYNSPGSSITANRAGGVATMRLNADDSLFAKTLKWTLDKPAGSAAALVGDTTHDPAFQADVAGTYTVTLVVNNGVADGTPATLAITVGDSLPVAADDAAATNPGTPITISVLANDQLGTQPTTITSISAPSLGTANPINGGTQILYSPSSPGTDSFSYTITDSASPTPHTSTATVTVTVSSLPAAELDTATTSVNQATTISVLANDNPGTTPTTITSTTAPAHGTVAIVSAGTQIQYTPANWYINNDSFTYTITDSNNKTSTGTVTVTVNPKAGTRFQDVQGNIFGNGSLCASCHSSGSGISPTMSPANYSTITSSTYVDKSNLPASAVNSLLLVHPTSPPSLPHGGGVITGFGNTGTQTSDCVTTTPNTTGNYRDSTDTTYCGNYNNVLEWIREGAQNN